MIVGDDVGEIAVGDNVGEVIVGDNIGEVIGDGAGDVTADLGLRGIAD